MYNQPPPQGYYCGQPQQHQPIIPNNNNNGMHQHAQMMMGQQSQVSPQYPTMNNVGGYYGSSQPQPNVTFPNYQPHQGMNVHTPPLQTPYGGGGGYSNPMMNGPPPSSGQLSGGSVTVSTTQQQPHSYYHPYYAYNTTTSVNIPTGQPPVVHQQPIVPMQPPIQQPIIQQIVQPMTVSTIQTNITIGTTSNSIKHQIMTPMHAVSQYAMKGEVILKSQNPFCLRSMKHSPTLILADGNANNITLIDSITGLVKEKFDIRGSVKGVGVDPSDDSFYVVSGQLILKYSSAGVHLGTFGKDSKLKNPYGVTVDDMGFVYICDYEQSIFVMTREGIMVNTLPVDRPYDIMYDTLDKYLVVSDQQKDCVRIVSTTGQKIRKIGSKGNAKGQFCSPSGVCAAPNGDILVADYGNHRIQVFDCLGRMLYCIGTRGKQEHEMEYPRSLCVDLNGNLFVAEYGNSRVLLHRKMQ